MLVGLMTVASAGCTLATAVLVEFRERPTRWARGCLNTLKLLRLTQYVAVSLTSCPAALEADIM